MTDKPKAIIYAAAVVLGTDGRTGLLAVLQSASGKTVKAVGGVDVMHDTQAAQVAACLLGLNALTEPARVELWMPNETVAQMCQKESSIAQLSRQPHWNELRIAFEKHDVTAVHKSRTDSPRMAAVAFAARELALAGVVAPQIVEDARQGVATGRGLMGFSPLRRQINAWAVTSR